MVQRLLLFIMVLSGVKGYSQNLGYEMRTNGKSYLTSSYKGFELRHRTDLQENRVTYRYNIKVDSHWTASIPLHYKIEKHSPTLEPRLVYRIGDYAIWVQQEFWYHEIDNLAIAIDIPSTNKKMKYRVGWDNSNTIRFRLTINI